MIRSICFFCSYYTGNTMPAYVKFYLREVKRHFSELVLVTNEKEMIADDIAFCKDNEIALRLVVNEGYDFGMWSKMFKEYDVRNYDRVGLINDSCILFSKLDFIFQWLDKEKADYCGLTDTYSISYHLQSYFMIINKRAIPLVADYFDKNGIVNDFLSLINTYEIGLSTHLINAGLTLKAYYPMEKGKKSNPAWMSVKKLIKKGYPLIKKKIISREYPYTSLTSLIIAGFDPYPMHYIKLIKKETGADFPEDNFSSFITKNDSWSEFKFNSKYVIFHFIGFFVQILSRVKRLIIRN